VDLIYLEWPGRRTGDVAAIQIVETVVAGTPNLLEVTAVLHDAAQMRTGGRKSAITPVSVSDQQSRTAAEAKNLGGVRLQFADLTGGDLITSEFRYGWGNEVAKHGIDKRRERTE